MRKFSEEKNNLLKLTSNGLCYYLQMKLLVFPVSTRLVYLSAKLGIHPNILSIIGILLSLTCLLFFQLGLFEFALLFFWARTVVDYSDGALARYTKKETKIGGILDGTSDKLFFFTIWILTALQINPLIGKLYFLFSCIAYLLLVDYFIIPRLKRLRKRAAFKQFFLDRGILFGMGYFIEVEFWTIVLFVIGWAPDYLWILVLIGNLDLMSRFYEAIKYYTPESIKSSK